MSKKKYYRKAIITGGAGFIGSHMVDLLIKKNFKVIVIDNLSNGNLPNIKAHLKNKNFFIKKKDINEINTKDYLFRNTDYIFHFAGIGDIVPSIEKPLDYMKTNVQGTIKILELARFNKVKKFVYAASSSCYGAVKGKVSEKTKTDVQHPYALSKYLGELAVFHWHKVYNLPVNSIRIFNAYGPRVRTSGAYGAVIGVFFKQKLSGKPLTIVGDGKQTRDFVHVSDVVKGFYLAATTKLSGSTFNLGAGKPTNINTLANIVGGKKVFIPNRPGEPRHLYAENKLIKSKLNWKAKIEFKDGITKMLEDIDKWKNAPLWTKKNIKVAPKNGLKYLK